GPVAAPLPTRRASDLASLARALGFHDLMNGTAAKPAPTAPTTAVVAVRNRRRPVFTGAWTSSLAIRHSENLQLVALAARDHGWRSEEHTSELQSRENL